MENTSENKNKIVIIIFIVFLLSCLGVFFYLKSQIKPDELKATIKTKLEESIPGAEISLGDLNIKYGTAFTVQIKGMDILLRESLVSKRDFLQVSHITVKLPLLSLLTGGGNIEVYLKKPELFLFRPEGKKGNWNIAFNSKPEKGKAITKRSSFEGSHNIILPAFLINSTAALRLSDFKVYYDISGKTGVWSASRLILKNVGIRSNAAFEVESNFKRVVGEEEKFSFDTVLIGSIELEKYLKTGKFHVNSNYKIKNLTTREHPAAYPLIRGNTSLKIDKTGAIEGEVSTLYQESELQAKFSASKEINELQVVKSNIKLEDISFLFPKLRNNFNFSQASLILEGRVKNTKAVPFAPNVKFKLTGINYLKKSFPFNFDLSGTFIEREVKTVFEGKIWSGLLKGNLEGTFDLNSERPFDERVSFFSGEFNFSGNTIPSGFMRAKDLEERDGVQSNVLLPKGIVSVNFENLTYDKNTLNGGFSLKTEKDVVEVSNGALLSGDGKVTFKSKAKLFDDEINWQHEFEFKKFPSLVVASVFPRDYPFLVGAVDGSLKGKFIGHPFRGEELSWKLSSTEGLFRGFQPQIIFKALGETTSQTPLSLKSTPQSLELANKDGKYKSLKAEVVVEKGEHHIKNLSFETPLDYKVFMSGFVDPSKEKTKRLIVQLEGDEKFQEGLKKKTKLKRLPLALYTSGYELSIDELYPLRQLAKKFRFKKDRNKAKKQILRVKAQNKRDKNEKS